MIHDSGFKCVLYSSFDAISVNNNRNLIRGCETEGLGTINPDASQSEAEGLLIIKDKLYLAVGAIIARTFAGTCQYFSFFFHIIRSRWAHA